MVYSRKCQTLGVSPAKPGVSPKINYLLICYLGFAARTLAPSAEANTWDLPFPVRKASVRAQGLRPREAKIHLAVAVYPVLSSDRFDIVDAPKTELSRLNTWPALSPVNASLTALQLQTHDSGPMWVASFLHRMELSSTTFRRF